MRAISSGAVQSFVSLSFLRNYLFPLPPLAEQKRIVEKIDRLMAQCDELEKRQQEREQKRILVHTSAVQKLLNAPEEKTFGEAWQFIKQNFGELYAVKENVSELRKAILQLAVMGKLVPQDPNDPPASELLKEITAEKQRLIKEGKIKPQKPLPEITADEIPYGLPDSWEWVRLGKIFELKSGFSVSSEDEKKEGKFMYLKVGEMNLPENEVYIVRTSRFLNPSEKMLSSLIPSKSIIFPKRGGAIATNKKRLVSKPIFADTNIMAMICPQKVDIQFAYRWLLSIDLSTLNSGTSVPQINNKDIHPLLFPLPPLPEQHRIVAKVDALMALCDQLENQIDQQTAKQTQLLEAVMARV